MLFLKEIFCKVIFRNTNVNDDVGSLDRYSNYEILRLYHFLNSGEDSKTFIDRPIIGSLDILNDNFIKFKKENDILPDSHIEYFIQDSLKDEESKNDFQKVFDAFINKNFAVVGSELIKSPPKDFKTANPSVFEISDITTANMMKSFFKIWEETSLFYIENRDKIQTTSMFNIAPFYIPGGRFREMYYWDSYWILKGLLVSNMLESAENMIKNFINMIVAIGYMPNGTREYYRNRSQPPVFPSMLLTLYLHNKEKFRNIVLQDGLSAAVKEYTWFQQNRSVTVELDKVKYTLNQYNVNTNFPRPESFKEDLQTAKDRKGVDANETFSNLKTAAESGWDFSTRWMRIEGELSSICIRDVIPVDLNALLYLNEKIISYLFKESMDDINSEYYENFAKQRSEAINKVLWNSKKSVWNDYNFIDNSFSDKRFFFSNITPLFVGIKIPEKNITHKNILQRYEKELFSYRGGIPASGPGEIVSKEQWDFPNAWAPHQSMMVNYLMRMNMKTVALHTARSFFRNVRGGFDRTELFYEKYHCEFTDKVAGGGEYATQTGFGWTNGTILDFYNIFRGQLYEDYDFDKSYQEVQKILRSIENEEKIPKDNRQPIIL